jgi:hypothetical protein
MRLANGSMLPSDRVIFSILAPVVFIQLGPFYTAAGKIKRRSPMCATPTLRYQPDLIPGDY